jgi:hypothetical protein
MRRRRAWKRGSERRGFEVHEGVCRPELQAQLVARHQFSRPREQQGQNLKRLFLKLDAQAVLAQLSCASIRLKDTEADDLCQAADRFYGRAPNHRS